MSGYSKKSAALREVDPAHALAEIRREKAERNLSDFIRQAWPIIEPGTEYVHNWHIDLISEYMEAVNPDRGGRPHRGDRGQGGPALHQHQNRE